MMTSHATAALCMVYNTFLCLYFLSTNSCGRSPLQKVLLNAKKACMRLRKMPIFFISRFPFLAFPISLFLVPGFTSSQFVLGCKHSANHSLCALITTLVIPPNVKAFNRCQCRDQSCNATVGSRSGLLFVENLNKRR